MNLWKSYLGEIRKENDALHARLLTDVTGQAYTLVLEVAHENFSDLDPANNPFIGKSLWKKFYQQFIPLCELSERTVFKLELNI